MGNQAKLNRGDLVGSGFDKLGREVEVYWKTDIDRPNRGFVAHRASGWHGDTCLGYVRVDYIDQGIFDELNPTIWNFMQNFAGHRYFDKGRDPRTFTLQENEKFTRMISNYLRVPEISAHATYDEIMMLMANNKILRSEQKKMDEMLRFHSERPYVGYSNVEWENEFCYENSKGKGVAKVIYCGTAFALRGMGKTFDSSGLQSDDAQAIWRRFHDLGWTRPVLVDQHERYRLCPDLISPDFFKPLVMKKENDIYDMAV